MNIALRAEFAVHISKNMEKMLQYITLRVANRRVTDYINISYDIRL